MDLLIGVAVGLAIFGSALWVIRMLANPPPPEEDATDLEEAIAYRCAVCGMQLTVTRAAGEGFKAPRHCMEEMEPTG
jgi:hypothetical protein